MFNIRPATVNDATKIVHIHINSWKAQFSSFLTDEQVKLKDLDEANQLIVWQRRLTDEEGISRHTFIAELDEKAVAYITGRNFEGDYDAELHQIYVLPEAHYRGIGKKLVSQLAKRLYDYGKRSMIVWVMTINPAISFYRDGLNGTFAEERIIPDGDGILKEVSYVWSDIRVLFS